jgi:hypothetical protein
MTQPYRITGLLQQHVTFANEFIFSDLQAWRPTFIRLYGTEDFVFSIVPDYGEHRGSVHSPPMYKKEKEYFLKIDKGDYLAVRNAGIGEKSGRISVAEVSF